MGKVVKLDAAATERPAGKPGARRRPRRSKTALVLGGGGFTGGVYEIGALRALDLLSVNRTVNEFDVYVGTSAGSFVAAAVANGITPEEMMRVIVRQVPTPFPDARISSLLKPNYAEFLTKGADAPFRLAQVLRDAGLRPRAGLGRRPRRRPRRGAPVGALRGRWHRALRTHGPVGSRSHRRLPPARHELYLAATDLDTCERIVFGAEGWDDVPISTAVSASRALPMLYKPVKIKDRELIDGGILSTTNLDIAVEAGAKFIVVVNPLVPYVNDFQKRIPTLTGSGPACVRHGIPADRLSDVQAARLPAAARDGTPLGGALSRRRHHPDRARAQRRADVPDQHHELHLARRHRAPRLPVGDAKLAHDYARFKRICARHGIEISATRVRKVVKHFEAEREKTRAWRKILEQTTSTLLRQSAPPAAGSDAAEG